MNRQHSGEMYGTITYPTSVWATNEASARTEKFLSDEQTCNRAVCLIVGGKRLQSESYMVVINKSQKPFEVNKVLFE